MRHAAALAYPAIDPPPVRRKVQAPLDRYAARGQLSPDPVENERLAAAGRMYGRQALASFGINAVTWSRERVDCFPRLDAAYKLEAAKARADAQRALLQASPEFLEIADWVLCGDERAADAWAVEKGRDSRTGIVVLRLALSTLAHHYERSRAAAEAGATAHLENNR